jgi:hypothetical protein
MDASKLSGWVGTGGKAGIFRSLGAPAALDAAWPVCRAAPAGAGRCGLCLDRGVDPRPSPLPLGFERRTPLRFRAQVAQLSHGITNLFAGAPKPRPGKVTQKPVSVGFYTTWSDSSAPSLVRHIGQLDWVAPTTLAIDKTGKVVEHEDQAFRRIMLGSLRRPLVVDVLQNVVGDDFSGAATQALFHSPRSARR